MVKHSEESSTIVMLGSHRNRQDLFVCLTANNEIGRLFNLITD